MLGLGIGIGVEAETEIGLYRQLRWLNVSDAEMYIELNLTCLAQRRSRQGIRTSSHSHPIFSWTEQPLSLSNSTTLYSALRIGRSRVERRHTDNPKPEPAGTGAYRPRILNNGECLAKMGPSSSGKSLFLRAIADLDTIDVEVILDEVERLSIPAPQWRRQVSYMPAEPGFWADDVGGHFANEPTTAEMTREMQFPNDVFSWPVERPLDRRMPTLVLASTNASTPLPFARRTDIGLDQGTGGRVEALIASSLAGSTMVLMVTDDVAQAKGFARRVLRLDAGKSKIGAL